METQLIDQKMTQLTTEMETAEAELAKLRPRVQYLEAILHRLDGALTVLQGMKDELRTAPVVAHASNQVAVPQGV